MKKLLLNKGLLITATIGLAGLVYGESSSDNKSRYPSYKGNNCYTKSCEVPQSPTRDGYLTPARWSPCGAWDVFFYGDFLYMEAREDHLQYAVSTTNSAAQGGNPPLNGKVENIDFSWHPGFRVGMGLGWDTDEWDILLEYTHLVSSQNTLSTAPDGGSLLLSWGSTMQASRPLSAGSAAATWKLSYNTIDLAMGRYAYHGKCLVLKPMFGLRGSWFPQRVNIQYSDVTDNVASDLGTTHINAKFNNWGIGPLAGVKGQWMLTKEFRLITDAAVSLEYTRFSTNFTEINPDIALISTDGIVTQLSNRTYEFRPNWEMALGFGWGTYVGNNRAHLDLSLTYEYHFWLDQNSNFFSNDNILQGQLVNVDGHLGMQGIAFRFRADF